MLYEVITLGERLDADAPLAERLDLDEDGGQRRHAERGGVVVLQVDGVHVGQGVVGLGHGAGVDPAGGRVRLLGLDGGAAGQHDQVGQRDLLAAGLRAVELLLYRRKLRQDLAQFSYNFV